MIVYRSLFISGAVTLGILTQNIRSLLFFSRNFKLEEVKINK